MRIWWYEEEKVVGIQNNGRDRELLDYLTYPLEGLGSNSMNM